MFIYWIAASDWVAATIDRLVGNVNKVSTA